MSATQAIGVFDSGVGGMTVAAALRQRLPEWPIVYLGDTARLPYGTKSKTTVERYTARNLQFLQRSGVSLVVVACNSASALALEPGQTEFDPGSGRSIEVCGVIEPGAERAAAITAGRVGVVATAATVESGAYARALTAVRPELEVEVAACPLLVPLVEEGWLDDPVTQTVVERYAEPLLQAEIDTLILGCTHYPLLREVFAQVVGSQVRLVDSAEAVAEAVARRLGEMTPPAVSGLRAYVTDASPKFQQLAETVLGEPVTLEWVDLSS